MSPVSRRNPAVPKPRTGEPAVPDRRTPLRIFRNTFKGNQAPMTGVMLIVLLGMVAYLAPSGRGAATPDSVAARVYGRDVLRRDVEQTLSDMVRRMGNQPNVKAMIPFLRAQAVRRTVDLKLYEELAERRDILVTDQEARAGLEARLRQYPFFLGSDGRLKPTQEISDILRGEGITLHQWEQEVRGQILLRKLAEQAASQVPVDAAWIERENQLQTGKVSFESVEVAPDAAAVADPGDGPLETFLKSSGARFQFGPRRVLQYVAVDASLFPDISVDDGTLRGAYESSKAKYTELDASHILFRASTDAEFAEATRKAEELRARLLQGGDFAKAAKELSEDPTAQTNGGRLGWFKSGAMVKPFEEGALALKAGEISPPVRTSFGVHLIKLEGRRDKTFDDVKEELRAQVLKDRFATRAKDRLEQLRKRAGDTGDLAAAAKSLGLPVRTSLPLLDEPGATLEGLPEPSAVLGQTFTMKVKEVSKTLQAGDRFVVFRVQEERPIAVPPLLEIRAKVLAAWKLEEARKRAAEKAKAAVAAKDLTALGAPAVRENVSIQSLGSLGEHPAIRKALLETAVDAFTPVLWTPEGKLWVARLKARIPAEPLTFERRAALVRALQTKVSQELLEAERKDLDAEGRRHGGLSSLWGRFGGVWMSPDLSGDGLSADLDE